MIPNNWAINAQDMDDLWPGNDYKTKVGEMGKNFFQTAQYGMHFFLKIMKELNNSNSVFFFYGGRLNFVPPA